MRSYKPIEFYDRYGNSPMDGYNIFSELGSHYFTFNKNGIATLISGTYSSIAERDNDLEKVKTQINRRDNFKILKKGLANYNLVLQDENKNELCLSRSYTSAIQANEVLFSFFESPKIDVDNSTAYDTQKKVETKKVEPLKSTVESEVKPLASNEVKTDLQNREMEAKTMARREALLNETSNERNYLPLLLLALIPILCALLFFRNCDSNKNTNPEVLKKEMKKGYSKAQEKVKETGNKIEGNAKKAKNKVNAKTKKVVDRVKEMKKNAEKSTAFVSEKVERDASGYEKGSIESEINKCMKNPNCYSGKRFLWGETNFKNNSSNISGDAHKSLVNIARMLQRNPNMRLTITGNSLTSENEYAKTEGLSTARANAVKNFLKASGAPGDRIYAYGNGQGNYINYNTGTKADYQNKRVDIILDGK